MISKCRVCGDTSISTGFVFRPYTDFETTVYDCYTCGCRFTNRDEHVYEKLHSEPSTYAAHRDLQSKAKDYFKNNDITGLEKYLKSTPKNRFVIESIKSVPNCTKILEYGCSRGYLSSFSILLEKEFYGVDVSNTALKDAAASFGNHFYSPELVNTFPDAYFDLIYHVGTIGCVDDPMTFISEQLKLLRSGGTLLFNAPNLDVCSILDLKWLTGTTPPDLVTLFPPTFWESKFSELAHISVVVEYDSPLMSYLRRKRSILVRQDEGANKTLFGNAAKKVKASKLRRLASCAVKSVGKFLPGIGLFAPLPQEFGVFVRMTKK